MISKVLQVAEEIWDRREKYWAAPMPRAGRSFPEQGESRQQIIGEAMVAIQAMRDPTEEMLEAGFAASGLDWADKRSDILEIWQAMIAEALK